MKTTKNILFIFLFLTALSVSGQKKRVAVVTFYANKVIDFSEIAGDKLTESLAKKVLDLRDNPKFNLQPLLEKYHDAFFNEYSKSFPFDLIPEAEVVNSESYKSFVPKYQMSNMQAQDYIVYEGYKYIYDGPMGAPNEEGMAKAMAAAIKADGVLFVHIDFAFEKGFGVGGTSTLKVKAFTRISLYNKMGTKLFVINENERSKKTMMMVGGVPVLDVDKILPNCESALEELMGDLNKRIQKIIKKTETKL